MHKFSSLPYFLAVLSFVFSLDGYGQLVSWNLTSNGSPTFNDPNIGAGYFNKGSGVGPLIFGASGARANGWSTTSIDLNKYFEITSSPNAGYDLNITGLNFSERRSNTGIHNYQVHYSLDNFSTYSLIGTMSVPDDDHSRIGNFAGLNIDVPEGTTIKFRFFGYNAEANTGTWRINNGTLSIDGSLSTAYSNTTVQFTSSSYTQTENGTSINLCVDIINPAAFATTAGIVLTSGLASELGGYTTETVTFPANSSAQECITINISDNATCDGNRDYTFELQNVTGGNSAAAGSVDETVLTISDDEQTSGTIAFQGFEGSGWGYTPSTPECINSDDIWSTVSNIETIYPSLGSFFFGIQDLNGDCGGSNFESLTFDAIPTSGYSNLVFSFDYNVFEYDSGDDIKYQIFIDGAGQGEVLLVDGNDNFSTSDWQTETIPYSGASSNVYIKISVKQNGADDYAGIDNVKLSGTGCITCEEPTDQADFDNDTPIMLTETGAKFEWTNGNGDNRLMVLREDLAVSTDPVDGTSYPANSAFGFTGTNIGTNEYAVYNGANENVVLTNLTPGTEYFAKIFEYNCLPGSEDYLTSGTPDTDVFITPPENPASFDEGCTGSTSMDLSWTAPANGNYDGYMLVARQGATPHSVNSLDPINQDFSSDWSSTPAINYTFGSGLPKSRVLYIGSATTATITNLVANADYTFEIFAYSVGTSGWNYSSGTTTSQNIHLLDVTNLSTTPHANNVEFSWNVDASCIDEIIIAASDVGGVTSVPTLTTGYNVISNSFTNSSNPTLSPDGEKVVYSNTGSSVTVTSLTTDDPYCFKVFVRKDSVWSQGVDICETPRDVTVLEPGDISIVAINTGTGIGDSGSDEICFVSYKSITPNTSIDMTDNGYERKFAGKWGDTEGVIRITRKPTAPTIPAGKAICIEGNGSGNDPNDFTIYTCGAEDTDWVVSSLNGYSQFDLNGSDQVWILQNGNWNTVSGTPHKATYTGNVLYGWTATGWKPNPGYDNTSGSTLYPNSFCLSTDLNSIAGSSDKVKYTGPLTALNRIEWIQSFNDYTKWSGFSSNSNYFSADPQYNDTCIQININPGISHAGLWTGNADVDWFNCRNWDNLRLPDETVDAVIKNISNDPIINGLGAACYDLIIETGGELTLNDPTSELSIFGNLSVEGNLIANTNGTIIFNGDEDQNITDSSATVSTINFRNLTIDKTAGNLTTDEHIGIYGNAEFSKGLMIPAASALITFQNNSTTSGASNESFVDGKVIKMRAANEAFTFPIGDVIGSTIAWYQPARIFGTSAAATIEAEYFAEANPNAGAYYDGDSNSPNDNQEISNCDYWTINNTDGANVKLALTYTNDDDDYCNVVGSAAHVFMYSYNDNLDALVWDYVTSASAGGETVSENAIDTGLLTGTYGDFALGGTSQNDLNVLPIQLTSFTAKPKNQKVKTEWTTSSETNNAFFTVQRSADAKVFQEIGKITGAGTSHTSRDYAFTDEKPLPGVSYYRLKQTDFDGLSTLSDIKAVSFTETDGFSLELTYRNDNELNLVYKSISPYILVEIFDVIGKRVFTEVAENYGGRSVLSPNLGRGAYVVRISAGDKWDSGKVVW